MNIILNYTIVIILVILIFQKKVNTIRIDDDITNKIVENVSIFEHIHPNIITISGLLLNFYIYQLLNSKNTNIYLLTFCIIYRWLADCLDGAIARKYNKQSKLGHQLDTISDIIMAFIAGYFIKKHIIDISLYSYILIYFTGLYIYNKMFDIMTTHDNLKNPKHNNLVNYIVAFSTNNTIIIYILLIIQYFN